jgi:hypothetical protein
MTVIEVIVGGLFGFKIVWNVGVPFALALRVHKTSDKAGGTSLHPHLEIDAEHDRHSQQPQDEHAREPEANGVDSEHEERQRYTRRPWMVRACCSAQR